MKKELDFEKWKKKVLLKRIIILLSILLIVSIIIFLCFNKTFILKLYINSNKEELQKIIDKEINLSDWKKPFFIRKVERSSNKSSHFIRFETGGYGFASNTCYTGFYYTEEDIMHEYEYNNRIIEGDDLKSYKVKEETGDNILYLTYIKDHWYYYKSCF